jgi:hypothetical protein
MCESKRLRRYFAAMAVAHRAQGDFDMAQWYEELAADTRGVLRGFRGREDWNRTVSSFDFIALARALAYAAGLE